MGERGDDDEVGHSVPGGQLLVRYAAEELDAALQAEPPAADLEVGGEGSFTGDSDAHVAQVAEEGRSVDEVLEAHTWYEPTDREQQSR